MRNAFALLLVLAAGCATDPDRAIGLLPAEPLFETRAARPVLRWEALPVPEARDVVYDLRVRGPDGFAVESRDALSVPEHVLGRDLEPGAEYRWTVRARFVLDGRPRSTNWTEVPPYRSRGALPDGGPPNGVPVRRLGS